jgi:hypothetical protein
VRSIITCPVEPKLADVTGDDDLAVVLQREPGRAAPGVAREHDPATHAEARVRAAVRPETPHRGVVAKVSDDDDPAVLLHDDAFRAAAIVELDDAVATTEARVVVAPGPHPPDECAGRRGRAGALGASAGDDHHAVGLEGQRLAGFRRELVVEEDVGEREVLVVARRRVGERGAGERGGECGGRDQRFRSRGGHRSSPSHCGRFSRRGSPVAPG